MNRPSPIALRGRIIAALTTVMMVAGQGFAVAHFTLVEHIVCAEHGELTHAPPSSTKVEHDPAGFSGVVASGHGDGVHDACIVPGRTREHARPGSLKNEPALNLTLRSASGDRLLDVSPEPTLSLAPKTSPPNA